MNIFRLMDEIENAYMDILANIKTSFRKQKKTVASIMASVCKSIPPRQPHKLHEDFFQISKSIRKTIIDITSANNDLENILENNSKTVFYTSAKDNMIDNIVFEKLKNIMVMVQHLDRQMKKQYNGSIERIFVRDLICEVIDVVKHGIQMNGKTHEAIQLIIELRDVEEC